MSVDLYMTGDGIPVCEAHLEKYIDAPYWLACQCDYDAWFHSHGALMSCRRCKGVQSDQVGDSVVVALSQEDSSEGRRGTASGRALDEKIVRQFECYINEPSYAD
jgi:hypothetical protein